MITVLNKIPQAAEIAANVSGYKPVLMRAEMPLKSVGSREIMCARCFGKNETVDVDYVQRCVKSHLSLGEIGLIGSTRKVFTLISNDAELADGDWSLILEEDAAIHPEAKNPKAILDHAITIANRLGYGFVYLGLCYGKCKEWIHNSTGVNCKGMCTHAYAITKQRARTFFDEVYGPSVISGCVHGKMDICDLDTAYNHLFTPAYYMNKYIRSKSTPVSIVAGGKFLSPNPQRQNDGHTGLMYQIRKGDLTGGSALIAIKNFTD